MGNIFRQQLLAFVKGDAPSLAIVGQLCLVDSSNREVASLRMTDEEAANRCRRLYRVVVGQRDRQAPFGIQQVEDDTLQRMVRTRGIAEGHS